MWFSWFPSKHSSDISQGTLSGFLKRIYSGLLLDFFQDFFRDLIRCYFPESITNFFKRYFVYNIPGFFRKVLSEFPQEFLQESLKGFQDSFINPGIFPGFLQEFLAGSYEGFLPDFFSWNFWMEFFIITIKESSQGLSRNFWIESLSRISFWISPWISPGILKLCSPGICIGSWDIPSGIPLDYSRDFYKDFSWNFLRVAIWGFCGFPQGFFAQNFILDSSRNSSPDFSRESRWTAPWKPSEIPSGIAPGISSWIPPWISLEIPSGFSPDFLQCSVFSHSGSVKPVHKFLL